jgi:hypothetical protein
MRDIMPIIIIIVCLCWAYSFFLYPDTKLIDSSDRNKKTYYDPYGTDL